MGWLARVLGAQSSAPRVGVREGSGFVCTVFLLQSKKEKSSSGLGLPFASLLFELVFFRP